MSTRMTAHYAQTECSRRILYRQPEVPLFLNLLRNHVKGKNKTHTAETYQKIIRGPYKRYHKSPACSLSITIVWSKTYSCALVSQYAQCLLFDVGIGSCCALGKSELFTLNFQEK